MNLLLARHGESEWMIRGDEAGSNSALTERGRQQARLLGRWLAADLGGIDAIYASTLIRARDTAHIVAAELGLPVTLDDDLREFEVPYWHDSDDYAPPYINDSAAAPAYLADSYLPFKTRVQRAARREDYDIPDAWFHWFDFAPYLAELHGFLAEHGPWLAATAPEGRDLRDRLVRLVDSCAEAVMTSAVDPGRESVPLRLCRVDPNLANAVWSEDGRLCWVDWEYSGWGDPALDLADLRWHVALAELSEAQHGWLRDNYRRPVSDQGFEERLVVWDRLLATRWPFLILRWLWTEHHGSDRVRLTQFVADPAEMQARLVRLIERAEFLTGNKRELLDSNI